MKKRNFLNNTSAISLMYDVALFMVMVSLSGLAMLPALQNNVPLNTSLDVKRKQIAEDTLNAVLSTRMDEFQYDQKMLITSKNREQLHKTLAQHIAENLAGQYPKYKDTLIEEKARELSEIHKLSLPELLVKLKLFSLVLSLQIPQEDFVKKLEKQIESTLDYYLADKYSFRFSAVWKPKDILLGEIQLGENPPVDDCFVSETYIVMPYNSIESFEKYIMLSAEPLDLPSIQRAKVRLVLWRD
ncbi:MAG: hypothetical protein V5A64_00705 [Candidatus Thermoplasmatota archaeon]